MAVVATMGDIQRELRRLEAQYCLDGNAHAFFLSTYIVSMQKCDLMVQAARDPAHLRHASCAKFDADLIESIAIYFGQLYLNAVASPSVISPRPSPWALALERSSAAGISPERAMLLGLVAHTCYDLPLVLSTPLTTGLFLYQPMTASHNATYHGISRQLTEELPAIARRIDHTGRKIHPAGGKRSSLPILYRFTGNKLAASIVSDVLHAAHREAELHAIRLQRGEMTRPELESLVMQRLSALSGKHSRLHSYRFLLRWFSQMRADRRLFPSEA